MSVFGGDSWGREVQQRKRRVDDLMLYSSSSSSSSSSSFKKLSNGKYVCLVCTHNPIVDSPLMLSMHNKGSRHIAAESRLKEQELSKQEELNKRLALSGDSTLLSTSDSSVPPLKRSSIQEKPLIEQTRRAILEAQTSKFNDLNARDGFYDGKILTNILVKAPELSTSCSSVKRTSANSRIDESSNVATKLVGTETHSKMLVDWHMELHKRQQKELKFTASGWKRDYHGKWYRDENVEFDSDEEDPNVCL
ncbi:uncharacterized protein [Typha angustifolia]|uniref:uncharacterized protein n=1 Tax=Typha angustifolia TaxID=59011 RepID=UPI003C3047BC